MRKLLHSISWRIPLEYDEHRVDFQPQRLPRGQPCDLADPLVERPETKLVQEALRVHLAALHVIDRRLVLAIRVEGQWLQAMGRSERVVRDSTGLMRDAIDAGWRRAGARSDEKKKSVKLERARDAGREAGRGQETPKLPPMRGYLGRGGGSASTISYIRQSSMIGDGERFRDLLDWRVIGGSGNGCEGCRNSAAMAVSE